jgi:hypothetical protein
MLSRSVISSMALGCVLALAGAAAAQNAPSRVMGRAPASQPESAGFAPTTQPGFTGVSNVSFYLTRSLPDYLQRRRLIAMRTLSRDQQHEGIKAVIDQAQISVKDLLRRKHELDNMPPERQDYYRQQSLELEELYSKLSAAQLIELRNMSPEKRAKRIKEYLAEMKAKAIRDGNKAPASPK